MDGKKTPDAMPDFAALALGSLFTAPKEGDATRPERTREERLAGIADLVRAMETSMEEDDEAHDGEKAE